MTCALYKTLVIFLSKVLYFGLFLVLANFGKGGVSPHPPLKLKNVHRHLVLLYQAYC